MVVVGSFLSSWLPASLLMMVGKKRANSLVCLLSQTMGLGMGAG
jgi:hypothetical protein